VENHSPTRAGGATYCSNAIWKNLAYMLETINFFMAISREVNYNKKMNISLDKEEKQIIIGNILGDGCVEFNGFRGSRLQIKQTERHKDYVFWLHNRLIKLCKSGPKKRKDTKQWYFSTRYLDELTVLYKLFYPKGKKIIPNNISDILISPLSLSVWYMDDGCLDYQPKDHYAFILNTDGFSFKDVSLLRNALSKNFFIETTIQTSSCRGKNYPRLYIGAKGRDKFLKLIEFNILNCFSHKKPPKLL
jgi:hypothetical protein